jgi:hypothetical protein
VKNPPKKLGELFTLKQKFTVMKKLVFIIVLLSLSPKVFAQSTPDRPNGDISYETQFHEGTLVFFPLETQKAVIKKINEHPEKTEFNFIYVPTDTTGKQNLKVSLKTTDGNLSVFTECKFMNGTITADFSETGTVQTFKFDNTYYMRNEYPVNYKCPCTCYFIPAGLATAEDRFAEGEKIMNLALKTFLSL